VLPEKGSQAIAAAASVSQTHGLQRGLRTGFIP
jgi:hypothetical protein